MASMLILATGTLTADQRARVHRDRPQQGFTFLEILAVIVIIGITITFASLSLSSRAGEDRLAAEAERLHALLVLASDEAIIQGEQIGLLVAADGYAFYHLEDNQWIAYEQGSLRERRLPEGMTLYLSGDTEDRDKAFKIVAESNPDQDKKSVSPQVYMLSSGELTPFTLQLRASHLKAHYQAEGDITGQIKIKRIGEQPT